MFVARKILLSKQITKIPLQSNFCTHKRPFQILGIETSCDDTGVALVDSFGVVKGEALASSPSTHDPYGGIKPNFAARDHERYINQTIEQAVGKTPVEDIDAIAVTVGPGLGSSLRVGIEKAKELAIKWKKPIIPINHLEGHALVVRMSNRTTDDIKFPFLLVLVSGGHSQILICKDVGDYLLLGGTVDDSLGEAFDKVARSLGFSFSEGGKSIESLALKGKIVYDLPIAMLHTKNCDLSFSGLKSAVNRLIENVSKEGQMSEQNKRDIAASFQYSAVNQLQRKVEKAILWFNENNDNTNSLTNIIIAGGVARNLYLRSVFTSLGDKHSIPVKYPDLKYCTDNGVMIAWAGMERYLAGKANFIEKEEDIINLNVISRYPLAKNSDLFVSNTSEVVNLKRQGLNLKFLNNKR